MATVLAPCSNPAKGQTANEWQPPLPLSTAEWLSSHTERPVGVLCGADGTRVESVKGMAASAAPMHDAALLSCSQRACPLWRLGCGEHHYRQKLFIPPPCCCLIAILSPRDLTAGFPVCSTIPDWTGRSGNLTSSATREDLGERLDKRQILAPTATQNSYNGSSAHPPTSRTFNTSRR